MRIWWAAACAVACVVSVGVDASTVRKRSASAPARPVKRVVAPRPAPVRLPPLEDVTAGQFLPATLLEAEISESLTANCPTRMLTRGSDEGWMLVNFDNAFRRGLGAQAGPRQVQVSLEAYRRCIDRAIAAIAAVPRYTLFDPSPEPQCLKCDIYMSHLAIQIPRLREVKALTYLAPARMADQDLGLGVRMVRDATQSFTAVQNAFRREAEAVLDERQDYVRDRRDSAIRQANRRATTTAIAGLAGFGMGLAMGLNAQQSAGIVQQQMQTDFTAIQSQLDVQLDAVRRQQRTVNLVSASVSDAALAGRWSDDGVRVVVPRFTAMELDGAEEGYSAATGALSNLLPIRFLVQVNNGQGSCTGSVVGPRLVLTNRHCVQDQESGAYYRAGAFRIGFVNYVAQKNGAGPDPWVSGVTEVYTSGGDRIGDVSNDWAFLVLTDDFGNNGMELVNPADVARRGAMRIAVAGFSGDLNGGEQITMHWGCRARYEEAKIAHQCRLFHGASGSPIFAVDGSFSRIKVLGVHSSVFGSEQELATGKRAGEEGTSPNGYDGLEKKGAASDEMYRTWRELRARQGS